MAITSYSHFFSGGSALLFEGQFSRISPHGTRVIPSRATIPAAEDVVDDVRHEERYGREIMHAAFESSVSGAED